MIDEKQLITVLIEGKHWAQKKIYELHSPAMMAVCVRYVGDYETARDVLQDGFIKVFTKIDSYNGTGAFGGWIRRIFVTTALEYLRRNDALKQSIRLEDVNMQIENVEMSAVEKLSVDELMKMIAELPHGFRTVFNLFAIEGYSHSEIAETLNIAESTSRSQYLRARAILQKNIQQQISYENERQYK